MSQTTDQLIQANSELITSIIKHELPAKLCNGTLDDDILYVYAAQDKKFFISTLRLMKFFSSKAPTEKAVLRLSKQIGFLENEESDYFDRCMKLTERASLKRFDSSVLPKVSSYLAFLDCMPETSDYKNWVTHLWCAEYLYYRWAHELPRVDNLDWKHEEWIRLHDGDHFEEWCEFLATEVNQFQYEDVNDAFIKTLQLEEDFFDACIEAVKELKA